MSLNKLFKVCSYLWYGAGGHQSIGRQPLSIKGADIVNADGKWVSTIRALNFNLRLFVDTWTIVPEKESANQNFTIKLDPTEQNFYWDLFLSLLHENGKQAIICPSGLFDWLKVSGYSQRKSACYNHSLSPSDPEAWKDIAHLLKLLAEYFKDKPYEVILQGTNEWDFRWNVMHELTPEESAVGQWEMIKAVQSVNPNQKFMLGCTLNPNIDTFNRVINKLEQLATAEGRTLHGLIWSDNHYVRDSGGNQGGGLADTPESQWNQTYEYRKELNEACKQRGMKWEITEHGYSTSLSTSFAALKQKAPALEGVSHEEAQGILIWRSMLMYASFSECSGVSAYHCKDGYEAEPFTYIGLNYDNDFGGKEDWGSKPAKIYLEQQLEKYGTFDVVKYWKANDIYYATLSNGVTLHWTDKVNIGNVTPMPTETTLIEPQPTTMIIGYSTKSDRSDFKELHDGDNLPEGSYYFEARGVVAPVYFDFFKNDITLIEHKRENTPPFDLHGGQPYFASSGQYGIFVDAPSEDLFIPFDIGLEIPTKEPVAETYIENGKVYFITGQGTYYNEVTKL